jgi:hypothetical protein
VGRSQLVRFCHHREVLALARNPIGFEIGAERWRGAIQARRSRERQLRSGRLSRLVILFNNVEMSRAIVTLLDSHSAHLVAIEMPDRALQRHVYLEIQSYRHYYRKPKCNQDAWGSPSSHGNHVWFSPQPGVHLI